LFGVRENIDLSVAEDSQGFVAKLHTLSGPERQPADCGPCKDEAPQAEQTAEKVLFCHPEVAAATEGSAFLRQSQEKTDSSGKPSPSE
jgi:hypothetical protein